MYTIEDEIDFYQELKKKDENEQQTNECCLITGMELEKDCVKLECGHSFNYDPLLRDIHLFKTKFVHSEIKQVPNKGIRCPYCRTTFLDTIPHLEGYPKVFGVNFYDKNLDYRQLIKQCIPIDKCSCYSCKGKDGILYKNEVYLCRLHLLKEIKKQLLELQIAYNEYCSKKIKEIIKASSKLCNAILKSGKRKGLCCDKVVNKQTAFCYLHNKKKNANEKK